MSKMNWGSASSRSRAPRNGTENISDHTVPGGLMPPRKRTSKADARRELQSLMYDFQSKKAAASGNATAKKPNHLEKGKAGRT